MKLKPLVNDVKNYKEELRDKENEIEVLNEDLKKKLDEINNSDLLYKWDASYEYALLYKDKGII